MSAQVTEAHLELAKTVIFSRDASGRLLTAPMAAKIIADSEALACAELRAELATCKDASEALVESLRAEVERLRECCDQTSALCGKFITEDDGTDLIPNSARIANSLTRLEARAERAEASLHALRLVCGTTDADKFSTWVDRANARAERAEAELKAERAIVSRIWVQLGSPTYEQLKGRSIYCLIDELKAELATERARIADLVADLNDACITLTSAEEDCDDYAMQNTRFKLTAVREVLLQHIPNAAMKEGA